MLNLRADNWMRVGSGLALLLVAAAHEKVCPAATAPPQIPEPTQPTQHKPGEKRPRVILPQILPDAPAPRWPGVWAHALSRETTGQRDGVQPAGPRDVSATCGLPTPSRLAWHAWLIPWEPAALVGQSPDRAPAPPAILTALCPTGPPRG